MSDIEAALTLLPRPTFAAELSAGLNLRAQQLAPTTVSPGPVIGVLADTHCQRPEDLPDGALLALAGSDLIVHCGDIGAIALLDRLATVAPVLAVRSGGDAPVDGVRLFEGPRLIRVGSHLIGVVAHVDDPSDDLEAIFGTSVDVVLTGTTHRAEIVNARQADGGSAVLVNPGSPTYPADGPASVALVEMKTSGPEARIVPIQ